MSRRPTDGSRYSNAEGAVLLGVSERTFDRMRSRGQLVNRPDGSLDVAGTISRRNSTTDPLRGGRADRVFAGAAPLQAPSAAPAYRPSPASRSEQSGDGAYGDGAGEASRLLKARTANEAIKAKLGQLKLRERTGELIPRGQALQAYADTLAAARSTLEGLPLRVSNRLVGLTAAAIRVALQAEIEAILKEMANGLDRDE